MFDVEKEVPSLELCKRLKELGFFQGDKGWFWVLLSPTSKKEEEFWVLDYRDGEYSLYNRKFTKEKIKAPTCREMEEWMPEKIEENDRKYVLTIHKEVILYQLS